MDNLRQFIGTVTALLLEIQRERENIQQNRDRCEFYANRLLSSMRHMYNVALYLERAAHYAELERRVKSLNDEMRRAYQSLCEFEGMADYSYRPPVQYAGGRGRPRFLITREQLQMLRNKFNSWAEVARDLGVTRQTIYNRRREIKFSLQF